MGDVRPWWVEMCKCKGVRKDGGVCNANVMRPYERRPGDLVIPLTCWRHADQERGIIERYNSNKRKANKR